MHTAAPLMPTFTTGLVKRRKDEQSPFPVTSATIPAHRLSLCCCNALHFYHRTGANRRNAPTGQDRFAHSLARSARCDCCIRAIQPYSSD
jgi:hypothetical protein